MTIRARVDQNAQYFGDGYRLTVWSPDPFSIERPGRLVIRVDVQGTASHRRLLLSEGNVFTLPDGQHATLVEIFVSTDGRSSSVEFELPDTRVVRS